MTNGPDGTRPKLEHEDATSDDRLVDPIDLVYKGGFTGDAREIVENPAVAPQTINPPENLRDDILEPGSEIGEEGQS